MAIGKRSFSAFVLLVLMTQLQAKVIDPPASPCPDRFSYAVDENGDWEGIVSIHVDPKVEEINLRVNLSLAAKPQDKNVGHLKLDGGADDAIEGILNGDPIAYIIEFPLPEPLPLLTAIVYNGEVICTGPPEILGGNITAVASISLRNRCRVGPKLKKAAAAAVPPKTP